MVSTTIAAPGVSFMARRDLYHDLVVNALIAEGWHITDDPLKLAYPGRDLFVDLGAESPIGAEKGNQKIAIEIKSFVGRSDVNDLEQALGQYLMYKAVLDEIAPDRPLFLAVPVLAYEGILSEPLGQLMIGAYKLQLIVFDDIERRIIEWIAK
jgi:hypothetical protein